jgi:hypothetical protein
MSTRRMAEQEKKKMNQQDRSTTLRASFIRQKLYARHAVGTAVRETLDRMSDFQLIALEDSETAAKIARIREKRDAKK